MKKFASCAWWNDSIHSHWHRPSWSSEGSCLQHFYKISHSTKCECQPSLTYPTKNFYRENETAEILAHRSFLNDVHFDKKNLLIMKQNVFFQRAGKRTGTVSLNRRQRDVTHSKTNLGNEEGEQGRCLEHPLPHDTNKLALCRGRTSYVSIQTASRQVSSRTIVYRPQ